MSLVKRLKIASTFGLALFVAAGTAYAKTVYVSKDGSDNGDGSSSKPYKTIGKAVKSSLNPGDVVRVRAGTYYEAVYMNKSGSPSAYVTLMSDVKGGAKLRPPSGQGILVMQAKYVIVDGFEVSNSPSSGVNATQSHHVILRNNISHNNAGAGIYSAKSEFITVEGNRVYQNAGGDGIVTSGISIHLPQNITNDKTTPGPRIILRNNIVYENMQKSGGHTDGSGIILDEFLAHRQKGTVPAYRFPSLIENNVVYRNGGAGIRVFDTDYATVRNNTVFHNSRDPLSKGQAPWRGELSNVNSSHTVWANNIAIADVKVNSGNRAISSVSNNKTANADVTWRNNITFNGTPGNESVGVNNGSVKPMAANGNKLGVDPMLVSLPSDSSLKSSSPAINAGTAVYGLPQLDIEGSARIRDGKVDMGAYEY